MPDHKGTPLPDDPAQSQRFVDMAKEISAVASQEEFERLFRYVISSEPLVAPAVQPRRRGWKHT